MFFFPSGKRRLCVSVRVCGGEERGVLIMKASGNVQKHLSSLMKGLHTGRGAGQMNKPLKINLTNYCLSHSRRWRSAAAHNRAWQMQRVELCGGAGEGCESDNFMFS